MIQSLIYQLQEVHVDRGLFCWNRKFRPFQLFSLLCFCLLCFFFGFEPGFRVPDPLQGEVVPPPLVLAFYKIDAHRGPPFQEKIENLQVSCRQCRPVFVNPAGAFAQILGDLLGGQNILLSVIGQRLALISDIKDRISLCGFYLRQITAVITTA